MCNYLHLYISSNYNAPEATQILIEREFITMDEAKYYLQGPLFGPYSFINISCRKEEMDDLKSSRRNIVEVALVIRIVQNLYKGILKKMFGIF